jgi:TetR/AcrR family transcriptional regulator
MPVRSPRPGRRPKTAPAPAKDPPGTRAQGGATRPRRARAPGRPGAATPAPDLRERVLDAALACYVRTGIAATSMRAIADEAAVTPALLHYYFGDKARLQAAVVEERLRPAIGLLHQHVARGGGDPGGMVAGFVRGVAAVVAAHPWLPSLWVREILCEGGALRDFLLREVGPSLPRAMATRFAQAQREGALNPGLDPRLLVVSLVGLTLFPAAGAPIWRQLFETGDIDPSALRDHTIALLDRGLELTHEA